MNPNIIWPAVSGGFILAFSIFESLGLEKDARHADAGMPSATYSAWWRRILGLEPRRWWRPLGVGGFIGFWTWFVCHIVFGIWG